MRWKSCLKVGLALNIWLAAPARGRESTSPGASPHNAVTLTKTGDSPAKGDFIVGYRFTVLTAVTVTDVGVFDRDGDGTLKGTEPIKIGLWDSTQNMILSADVPLKTTPKDGVFYTEVKPLMLEPGDYVIAYASPEDGERYWFGSEIETAPEIKWVEGRYASGKDLTLPTNTERGKAYFGPDFRFIPAGANYVSPTSTRLVIDQPDDRKIIQRDDHNMGDVGIACTAPKSVDRVEVCSRDLQSQKPVIQWVTLTAGSTPSSFTGHLKLPAGWYRLEFRASSGPTSLATAAIDHIGVGEVFLTCGQSNSCNHGRPLQKPADDRVSACDWQSGNWRHADDPQPGAEGDGGSPWPILGDLLAKQYDVPVGFISVGVGATSVEQWLPGGDLYRHIKTGLGRAGPHGIRAVLWHQGEQDSVAGTSSEEYYHALSLIIAKSRRDAGWQVPWGVALASYHPSAPAVNYPAIISGQKRVIEKEENIFTGPSTDDFHNHDWMADGVHFNQKGLTAHAQGWVKAIEPLLDAQKFPPPR